MFLRDCAGSAKIKARLKELQVQQDRHQVYFKRATTIFFVILRAEQGFSGWVYWWAESTTAKSTTRGNGKHDDGGQKA